MTRFLLSIILITILPQVLFGIADSTIIDSARTLNNRGIEYLWSGDYNNAEILIKKSLNLKKQFYKDTTHIYIANAYNNIGLIKMDTWQYDSALIYLKNAEEIYLKFNNTEIGLANLNSNKGKIYKSTGDFQMAGQYYTRALQILKPISNRNADLRRAETYNRLGLLKVKEGKLEEAKQYYLRGINEYNFDNEKLVLHYLYGNLASVYIESGNFSKANELYLKAMMVIRNSPELSQTQEARILQKHALLYATINDRDKAFASLQKAQHIYETKHVDSTNFQSLYFNFAKAYDTFLEYDSAIFYFQKSLFLSSNQFFTNLYQTPSPQSFGNNFLGISHLRAKAECLLKWNTIEPNDKKLESALNALETATQLIDISRNGFLSMESKLLLAENETPVYYMGIKAAYNLYNKTGNSEYLEKAFLFAEKNKSSVLSSVLQEEKAKSFSNIPKHLLEAEQSLKREITFYKERIYEESLKNIPDSNKLSTWNNYLFNFTRDQDQLKHKIEQEYPEYYALKYNQKTPGIQDIQKLLRRNMTIIEYTMTDSSLFVFHINKKDAAIYEIKTDSSFMLNTFRFLNYLRNFSYMNQENSAYLDFNLAGQELYNTLIAPIGVDNVNERLIIIPDDILSYIPFEALIKSDLSGAKYSYSELDFLINHYSISYSYSASLLHDSWTGNHRKFHNKLLSISPTYNPRNTEGIVLYNSNKQIGYRDNLQPIPHAIDEAKLISSITKGKCVTGDAATEEYFYANAGNYDILHLAMHTIIDDNNPLFSKLVFYDENYSSDKGLLTTNEIFGLNLKAKMTVLSSCSSGEGEIKKGEGVLSLARGFFYAGCPSLVMTLWKVEDKSGLILMQNYYKYLIRGYSKPRALQKAKLDYLNTVPNEKRHPFYWSAYICIGNPSPIYYPKAIIYIIVGIIVLGSMFSWFKLRNKKKKTELSEPNL